MSDGLSDGRVIRTPDQRLRVFVSSTLDELADERRAVRRAILALRLTPVMFELGARPHPPRDVYRAYLTQSDVFIGLYWQLYGWVGPDMSISGLEDEFELASALPRLLYVKAPAPDRAPRLAELLARIKQDAAESYRSFRTPAELSRLVRDDLATLLSERFVATAPAVVRPGPRTLPASTTPLLGRDRDIEAVADLLGRPNARLVTLTGPGGVGKTRLAIAVGERVRDRFEGGTAFVALAAVTESEQVPAAIARAVGANLRGVGAPLQALVEEFGEDRWLLILDNLEQVIDVAHDLDALLARCPGLAMLVTSRTALRLRAEREYRVPPLPLPVEPATVRVEELAASPAVALFVDRARAVRPDFVLTQANALAVVEICRRVEGLPLAIELAAARTRLLDPDALLGRLARSLDALGTGTVDLPQRQRTLRATIEWSVGLLEDDERSLLEIVTVFVGGWTIEAAARVAQVEDDRALELCEALARHSLIELDNTEHGPRSRMLETVCEFVAERLAARPDAAEVKGRHAECFQALAERADRPLRGVGWSEWADRLQADAGNLATAVGWYLANDRGPLPHLFRVLWPFWEQRDHMGEARSWVEELLPTTDSLDSDALVELLWTALVTDSEVGDDAKVLSTRERLAPLLDAIKDPYLEAVCKLAMAWTLPIMGDLDGALRGATASLEQFRSQDEPFWMAVAVATAGNVELALGRYGDALRRLTEARQIAERLDNAWLAAWTRVQLGSLAVIQGRLPEASALLDEGLDLSLAARSTAVVSLCLVGFAQLALAEGNTERAALAAGAAEGMRQRVGMRAWPIMRPAEAHLVAQLRQASGTDEFDQAYAAGFRLNQREAVAAIRERRAAKAADRQS